MASEIVPDDVVKAHVVYEYGQALASVAERFLRYPDRMSSVRSDAERRKIDEDYARILIRVMSSHGIAVSALRGDSAGMVSRSGIRALYRYFIDACRSVCGR
jgi:hypothetical protein